MTKIKVVSCFKWNVKIFFFFFLHKGEKKWLQEQLPDPSESNEQKIQLTRTKADFRGGK